MMKLKRGNISEIQLNFSNISHPLTTRGYSDELKISHNSVSYQRYNRPNYRTVEEWCYRSNTEEYTNKYYNLLDKMIEFFTHKPEDTLPEEENNGFALRIRFEDGTCAEYFGKGTFQENHMEELAKLILEFVPRNELHSEVLD